MNSEQLFVFTFIKWFSTKRQMHFLTKQNMEKKKCTNNNCLYYFAPYANMTHQVFCFCQNFDRKKFGSVHQFCIFLKIVNAKKNCISLTLNVLIGEREDFGSVLPSIWRRLFFHNATTVLMKINIFCVFST